MFRNLIKNIIRLFKNHQTENERFFEKAYWNLSNSLAQQFEKAHDLSDRHYEWYIEENNRKNYYKERNKFLRTRVGQLKKENEELTTRNLVLEAQNMKLKKFCESRGYMVA